MSQASPFQNKIKIYSDGADKAEMLEMAANPIISGLTTNPTLMKKAGVTDYRGFCLEILQTIKTKPLSFEVFTDDIKDMGRQAREISAWGKNVYVKIPITNTEGQTTIPLIKELSHTGIKLNVTAILTHQQVIETVQAVKGGAPSIVSIFAGRIADTGRDPMPIMTVAAELCRSEGDCIELLWASSREALNIVQAELAGCHIITAAPAIIKKMETFGKDLAQLSLETVRMFRTDAEAAGYVL